jgi:hypothetical protein
MHKNNHGVCVLLHFGPSNLRILLHSGSRQVVIRACMSTVLDQERCI